MGRVGEGAFWGGGGVDTKIMRAGRDSESQEKDPMRNTNNYLYIVFYCLHVIDTGKRRPSPHMILHIPDVKAVSDSAASLPQNYPGTRGSVRERSDLS